MLHTERVTRENPSEPRSVFFTLDSPASSGGTEAHGRVVASEWRSGLEGSSNADTMLAAVASSASLCCSELMLAAACGEALFVPLHDNRGELPKSRESYAAGSQPAAASAVDGVLARNDEGFPGNRPGDRVLGSIKAGRRGIGRLVVWKREKSAK